MTTLYRMIVLITLPFYHIGRFIEKNLATTLYIPSIAVSLFLLYEFLSVKYESAVSMFFFALLYLTIGGLAIAVLNAVSSLVIAAAVGISKILIACHTWADGKTKTGQDGEEGLGEDAMEFYRAMTEDRGYTMCYDPAKK